MSTLPAKSAAPSASCEPWIVCPQNSNTRPSPLQRISRTEFVRVPWTHRSSSDHHLHIFNVNNNQWSDSIAFLDKYHVAYHTSMYDSTTQLLYTIGDNESLGIFDLQKKTAHQYADSFHTKLYYPTSMLVDHEFHVVCGERCNQHFKWDAHTQQFVLIHTFGEFNESGMMRSCLVYIESKRMALLIGGKACGPYKKLNTIYSYSVPQQKWSLLPIQLPHQMCDVAAVLSADEKYLILCGGNTDKDGYLSAIHILNVEDWTLVKSKVQLPETRRFDALLMDNNNNVQSDELTVWGYMRRLWRLNEEFATVEMIPLDLVHLIIKWLNAAAFLHVICGSGHWKIDARRLFE